MGLDVGSGTAGQAALRIRYAKGLRDVTEQVDKAINTPFWHMLTRKRGVPDSHGQAFVLPIRGQFQGAVSADMATAVAKAAGSTTGNSSRYDAFSVPIRVKYGAA